MENILQVKNLKEAHKKDGGVKGFDGVTSGGGKASASDFLRVSKKSK